MSKQYETKFEDIKVGDIVVAKWEDNIYSQYVFRVKEKTSTHLKDSRSTFPSESCKFFVLGDSYITISGGYVIT